MIIIQPKDAFLLSKNLKAQKLKKKIKEENLAILPKVKLFDFKVG